MMMVEMVQERLKLMFLLASAISAGKGFLTTIDNNCPMNSPCLCLPSNIYCNSKGLIKFPPFKNTSNNPILVNRIYIRNNSISTIPHDAFINLTGRTDNLRLDLSKNNISFIDPGAFKGIENTTMIDLRYNNLHTLPRALTILHALKELHIQYNPISTFEASVIQGIGRSLQQFSFGSSDLQQWPMELHLLQQLKQLGIYTLQTSSLPSEAFLGLEQTLESLSIYDTKIEQVPSAICSLVMLRQLYLSGNYMNGSHKQLPSCNTSIATLTGFTALNNNLTSFPNVFNTYLNVTSLFVTRNPHLHFIDWKVIPNNTRATHLTLDSNGFYCVPDAIFKMKYLWYLDLSNNNIMALGTNSLKFLELKSLLFRHNPIEYISPNAFFNTPKLSSVDLTATKLTTVPEALSALQDSHLSIHLSDNKIKCTCELGWMQSWLSDGSVSVYGSCESSFEEIVTYVGNRLSQCKQSKTLA